MYHYLTPEELAALDAHDDLLARRAAQDVRALARELLYLRLAEHGRAVLGDPRHPDLSYFLWRAVREPKRITEEQANELQRLHDTAGGWWLVSDLEMPRFVEDEEWQALYEEYWEG